MHCTEIYLQVEEYKNVLELNTRETLKQISFKAEVQLCIRLKAITILTIISSLSI